VEGLIVLLLTPLTSGRLEEGCPLSPTGPLHGSGLEVAEVDAAAAEEQCVSVDANFGVFCLVSNMSRRGSLVRP